MLARHRLLVRRSLPGNRDFSEQLFQQLVEDVPLSAASWQSSASTANQPKRCSRSPGRCL